MSDIAEDGSAGGTSASAITGGPRRYGGASADERKAQRRERLIEAGFVVFGRDGYLKTTMRLVCAQARLSERYFYESFESTEALFRTVHRRESAKSWTVMQAEIAASGAVTGVEMMRAGMRAFFRHIKEDPRRAQILLTDAVTGGMADPQRLGTLLSKFADVVRDRLLARYPEMRQELVIDYVAGGLSGLIIQVGSVWVSRGFDTSVELVAEHVVYVWRGLHLWLEEASLAKRAAADQPGAPSAAPKATPT
jgi:AcrR family transcriptional regulator